MAKSEWKIIRAGTSARPETNRINAQASTGPRTPEGKQSSLANATIHGLTSTRTVLASEDPKEFQQFRHQLEREFAPVGFRERVAFEEYVNNLWRLRRCRRIEPGILDACMQSVLEENPGLELDEALARVFVDDKQAKKLRLFLRYQTAIERALQRALTDLKKLQRARKNSDTAAPPLKQPASEFIVLSSDPCPISAPRPQEADGFVSKL